MNKEILEMVGKTILTTFISSSYIFFMMITAIHYTQSNMECNITQIRELITTNEYNYYNSNNYMEVNISLGENIPYYQLENHLTMNRKVGNMVLTPQNEGTLQIRCTQ